MDSDRVLIMSSGSIVEFDHPYELLQMKDGYFNNMVKDTGTDVNQYLRGLAKEAYEKRKNESD